MSSCYFTETVLNDLPNELIHGVFRLFDIMKLVKYSRVCKRWNCLINDVRLWKKLSQLYRIGPMVQLILRAPLLHTFQATNTRFCLEDGNGVVEFATLVDNCPCLQVLDMDGCRNIHHETWQKIASASWSLKRLSICSCNISQEDMDMVLNSHNRLRVLKFTPPEVLYTLGAITQLTELTCLLLERRHSGDSVLRLLNSIGAQLVQISLLQPATKVVAALPRCTRLKVLALEGLLQPSLEAVVTSLKTMTSLTHLKFGCTGSMSAYDQFVIDLFGVLCNLEFLSVSRYSFEIHETAVRSITKTIGERLRYLSVRHSGVLLQIINKCPEMECLSLLSGEILVTQPLTDMTAKMPKLRRIYVVTEKLKRQMSVMFPKAGCVVTRNILMFPDISHIEWRDKLL